MGLLSTFTKAADTCFTVFKEAVKPATFYSIVDTGFDDDNSDYPVTIIEESFSEDDIKYLSFSEFIQPNDVKGLVRGKEIQTEIHSQSDKIGITQKDSTVKMYTIVAFDRDPLSVLYTFLLRKT